MSDYREAVLRATDVFRDSGIECQAPGVCAHGTDGMPTSEDVCDRCFVVLVAMDAISEMHPFASDVQDREGVQAEIDAIRIAREQRREKQRRMVEASRR